MKNRIGLWLAIISVVAGSFVGVIQSSPVEAIPSNCIGNVTSNGYAGRCTSGNGTFRATALCKDSFTGKYTRRYGKTYRPARNAYISVATCGSIEKVMSGGLIIS